MLIAVDICVNEPTCWTGAVRTGWSLNTSPASWSWRSTTPTPRRCTSRPTRARSTLTTRSLSNPHLMLRITARVPAKKGLHQPKRRRTKKDLLRRHLRRLQSFDPAQELQVWSLAQSFWCIFPVTFLEPAIQIACHKLTISGTGVKTLEERRDSINRSTNEKPKAMVAPIRNSGNSTHTTSR